MARRKTIKTTKAKNKNDKTVEGDLCFFVNDGRVVQNMRGLSDVLSDMPDEVYTHHVNAEKNDFANWVGDVFGHKKLAQELKRVKKKESALKKVDKHLNM